MLSKQIISLIIVLIFTVFHQFAFSQSDASVPSNENPTVTQENNNSGESEIQYSQVNNNNYRDEVGSFSVNGYLGGLNAAANYVSIADHNDFYQNANGSMEMWINPVSVTNIPILVSKGATAAQEFLWGISSTGMMFFRLNTGVVTSDGPAVPLGVWSHVAVSWTLSGTTWTIKFYMNGTQNGANKTFTPAWAHNTDAIRVGGSQNWPSEFFNGAIDEFRFWNDERTLAEIRDNRFISLGDGANANAAGSIVSSASYVGLISSYTFNTTGTAYDDISAHNGSYVGGANAFATIAGQPIPYNFALKLPFGANDYVSVASNSAFNQSANGTMEAWVYPTGQTTTHMIASRGTTGFDLFWGIRSSVSNKMVLCVNNVQLINTAGATIPMNTWSHVAVKWVISGGTITATFYLNGVQTGTPVPLAGSWSSNSGTLRIGGWHGGTANNFNGYIDEFRFWGSAQTADQIKQNMYTSGRALLPNTNLVGIWNFDGNLIDFSAITGTDATFSTGGTNNARLSAYTNETSSGAISTSFDAHPTVVNRNLTPNPFPQGFVIKPVNLPIVDNATTSSTINVTGSGALTSIEVFLSVEHTFVADLDITLVAPNGQTRELSTDNGGSGNHVATIFVDGATNVTTATFMPPWSGVSGPEQAMGNFGNTNILGNWTINVADDAGGDVGVFKGWGIRLNGAIVGIDPGTGNIPNVFALHQNYPNPFNPVTTINFELPKDENVKIKIFDMLGKEVAVLVNEYKKAGNYEIVFNGSNLASGAYFYRIDAGDFTDIKKMILIK